MMEGTVTDLPEERSHLQQSRQQLVGRAGEQIIGAYAKKLCALKNDGNRRGFVAELKSADSGLGKLAEMLG